MNMYYAIFITLCMQYFLIISYIIYLINYNKYEDFCLTLMTHKRRELALDRFKRSDTSRTRNFCSFNSVHRERKL